MEYEISMVWGFDYLLSHSFIEIKHYVILCKCFYCIVKKYNLSQSCTDKVSMEYENRWFGVLIICYHIISLGSNAMLLC